MNITILKRVVKSDKQGRFSLNDLHNAAVLSGKATESQRPGAFLQSRQIKRFVESLSDATNIASVSVVKGGVNQGTYGHELLVLRYAAWIDADFEVEVYQTFLEEKSNRLASEKARQEARLEYRPMTDAIKSERELAGKDIKPHHFSNEADLINRIALGMTAAKFRAHHELKKDVSIRDYLTPEQIRCVVSLQRANTVYIEAGMAFEDRKLKLRELYDRNHHAKLIAEVHLLEA